MISPSTLHRRQFLTRSVLAASGLRSLAFQALLANDQQIASAPHFPPRAKRIIFLFMSGGPSQIDLLDPKPKLEEFAGRPLPIEQPKLVRTRTLNAMPSPFRFSRYGQSGIPFSELLPNLATHADDLCVVRSMVADNINHDGACLQMNTGEQTFSRPCLGSWCNYGLGTENENLPGFVVISPAQPAQGAPLWNSSFLPASNQGTLVSNLDEPIANLRRQPARFDGATDEERISALRRINELHRLSRQVDLRLKDRMDAFELAFRMQREAPEAFSINAESAECHHLYGIDRDETSIFGKQCLLARRLVERGVRFVQLYHTQTSIHSSCQLWDQHRSLRSELAANCLATDRPIAGLLTDLKRRGLFNDTLVIWGGEFGRTPTAEGSDGREHHPFGFSIWLAGGGIRSGQIHGATDEFGWHAVENRVHVHDLHATILYLLGLDHRRLTYRHAGRDYRLTDVRGTVVNGIVA